MYDCLMLCCLLVIYLLLLLVFLPGELELLDVASELEVVFENSNRLLENMTNTKKSISYYSYYIRFVLNQT